MATAIYQKTASGLTKVWQEDTTGGGSVTATSVKAALKSAITSKYSSERTTAGTATVSSIPKNAIIVDIRVSATTTGGANASMDTPTITYSGANSYKSVSATISKGGNVSGTMKARLYVYYIDLS